MQNNTFQYTKISSLLLMQFKTCFINFLKKNIIITWSQEVNSPLIL